MTALEMRICHTIWRFDPYSLLLLLRYLGYQWDDILFVSHFSACSQSRLIETIEFQDMPKKVVITLNMGLLGGQSVLPNYLFQQVDKSKIDSKSFAAFFGYFDDRLLRRFLFAAYPELNQGVIKDWEAQKNDSLYTLKLETINSLHWLFQLVFPELQLRIKKMPLKRYVSLSAPILGKVYLGHQTVFGKRKELVVPGKHITLISDEEYFTSGESWVDEIHRRSQQWIFPILRNVGINLDIWLLIRSQGTALSLQKQSYLGYENLFSEQLQFRRIHIFLGYLCD